MDYDLDLQSMKIDLFAYNTLIKDLCLKSTVLRSKCKNERDYIESFTKIDVLTLPYEREFEILSDVILSLEEKRDILLENLKPFDSI